MKGDVVSVLVDIFDRVLKGSITNIIKTGQLNPKALTGTANAQMKKLGQLPAKISHGFPEGILFLGFGIAQNVIVI